MDPTGSSNGSNYDASEWQALLRLCRHALHLILWALWAFSLQGAAVMFIVFDSDVSARDGLILGLIQATWVAGIPIALSFVSHVLSNGWQRPNWEVRWLVVGFLVVMWLGILLFWLAITPSVAD